MVTHRKGMLVAQLLITYPPDTRKAPSREAVFSPHMSQAMATRGPWGEKSWFHVRAQHP